MSEPPKLKTLREYDRLLEQLRRDRDALDDQRQRLTQRLAQVRHLRSQRLKADHNAARPPVHRDISYRRRDLEMLHQAIRGARYAAIGRAHKITGSHAKTRIDRMIRLGSLRAQILSEASAKPYPTIDVMRHNPSYWVKTFEVLAETVFADLSGEDVLSYQESIARWPTGEVPQALRTNVQDRFRARALGQLSSEDFKRRSILNGHTSRATSTTTS